jgi:PqqA peptide cyclase
MLVHPKPQIEVWFELEPKCNIRCQFCYNFWRGGAEAEPRKLSLEELKSGLEKLFRSVDVQQISFSGGEPLLRRDLEALVQSAKTYVRTLILTTNGTLLTRERAVRLIDAGITHFQIPLHSHLEDVHDELSGARCWRKCIEAILLLRELGAPVTTVFVATGRNHQHFSRMLRLCGELGLTSVIFSRLIVTGLAELYIRELGVPTDVELLPTLEQGDAIASKFGIHINLGVPIQSPEWFRARVKNIQWGSCPVGAGQRKWVIGPDLEIRRCNSSSRSIGNLRNGDLTPLLQDLATAPRSSSDFVGCQLPRIQNLVQIRPAAAEIDRFPLRS